MTSLIKFNVIPKQKFTLMSSTSGSEVKKKRKKKSNSTSQTRLGSFRYITTHIQDKENH